MSAACAAAVLGRVSPPRPPAPLRARARRSRCPRGRPARVLASVGASPLVPAPPEAFSSLGASFAMVSGTTAGMPTETVGVLAAAATPLLGAIGLFIWNKTWTGDAFALNLVKCWVGTIGFVVAGMASRRGDWLSDATPEVAAWLVLSAFIGISLGDNLWLYSLRVIGARRVILIDILKPFIALGLAKHALGEGVSVAVALGMCVTLAGVLAVSLEENKNHANANANETIEVSGEVVGTTGTPTDADTRQTTGRDEEKTHRGARGDAYVPKNKKKTDEDELLEEEDEKPRAFSPSVSATTVAGSKMITGYFAAAANVALDTWGTVLTKQHGGSLNTWEINFVRFGSAAATLALVAAAKVFLSRLNRRGADFSPVASLELDAARDARHEDARDDVVASRVKDDVPRNTPTSTLFPALSIRAWVQILTGVAFTTFLAPGLGNYALFRVSSLAIFSTLMCVGPIYALPLGKIVNDEPVTPRALIGSVVAILGTTPMFFGKQWGLP